MGPETTRLTSALLALGRAYAEHKKLKLTTVGMYAVNDSQLFSNVERGILRTTTYDRAMEFFDAMWPKAGLPWPASVPRPIKPPRSRAAQSAPGAANVEG